MRQIKTNHSAKYLLLALAGSIFVGEILIMFFIDLLPDFSSWQEALLDASLLLTLVFPAIYFLAFRPLKTQLMKQEQIENELFATNNILREHEKELEMKNFKLKSTNIALAESNERYSQLFDFAPVGYLVLADDGQISEANLTASTLLGVEKNNLLNRSIVSFLSVEEYEHWQAFTNRLQQDNNKKSCKLIIQRDDGDTFYALLDCRRDESLLSPNIRVSFTDITKQNWSSYQ